MSQREADIMSAVRVAASAKGWRLWRNNTGVAYDVKGRPVRFGLANDSAQGNKLLKSADLIGIAPRVITQEDVGRTVGLFVALEVKRPDGRRLEPQAAFLDLINSLGGYGQFITGVEDLP